MLPSSDSSFSPQFDVQVRVQRSFSFEELQSGSYFDSLDESDLQFYRVYGQPILIPSPDDHDANFAVHASACGSSLHLPCPFSNKSYTLQNPLGESLPHPRPSSPPPLPVPSHGWHPVKQEQTEGFPNPAAIACQLYTLPDHDDLTSPSDSLQYPSYFESPAGSLAYPPSASPSSFPSQPIPDRANVASPAFVHDPSHQIDSPHDHWEDRLVPTQSYMLGELPSPASTAFSYTSSLVRSRRRLSRSPSPPLRMSPGPHTKRSLDKKPALACLFCRGRKIACGPPHPDSKDKTCNQCARRHLKCEYPLESRRGMRKRRSLIPRTSSPDTNPDRPRVHIVKANRKRSVDKTS